jgi:hypothetical protein
MRTLISATLGLLLAACVVGPRIETYAPAGRANGTEATVVLQADGAVQTRTGELIAVRDTDFLVLTADGLERIPHEAMRSAEFSDASPDDIRRAGTSRQRSDLARYSRYPSGLNDQQLFSLLAALGQSELIEVVP